MTGNVSQAEMQRARSEREARRSDKRGPKKYANQYANKCSDCPDRAIHMNRRLSNGGCGLCATCEKRRKAQATDNGSDSAQPARKQPRSASFANASDSDSTPGNGSEEAGSPWVSIGVSVRIPSSVFRDDTAPECGFWEGKTVRSAKAGLGYIGIKVQGENVFVRPMSEVARWVFADPDHDPGLVLRVLCF